MDAIMDGVLQIIGISYPFLGIWSLFIKPSLGKVIMKIIFLCGMAFISFFILAMFIDSPVPSWVAPVISLILGFALFVSFKW